MDGHPMKLPVVCIANRHGGVVFNTPAVLRQRVGGGAMHVEGGGLPVT